MLGFDRFTGEWATKEIGENQIQIDYSYNVPCQGLLFGIPLNWLFVYVFLETIYEKSHRNVKESWLYIREPYLYLNFYTY